MTSDTCLSGLFRGAGLVCSPGLACLGRVDLSTACCSGKAVAEIEKRKIVVQYLCNTPTAYNVCKYKGEIPSKQADNEDWFRLCNRHETADKDRAAKETRNDRSNLKHNVLNNKKWEPWHDPASRSAQRIKKAAETAYEHVDIFSLRFPAMRETICKEIGLPPSLSMNNAIAANIEYQTRAVTAGVVHEACRASLRFIGVSLGVIGVTSSLLSTCCRLVYLAKNAHLAFATSLRMSLQEPMI